MTVRRRTQVPAAEMESLQKNYSVTLRDKVRSFGIRKTLNVEPLPGTEWSQLRWLYHVTRKPQERLVRRVLLAAHTRKRSSAQPRARWCDHNSNLSWSSLNVESAELSEIVENREVFRNDLLDMLPQRRIPDEKRVLKLINSFYASTRHG